MGDTHRSGAGSSDGPARHRDSSVNASALLTPPTGLPAVGGLESAIPAQRSAPADEAERTTTPRPPGPDPAGVRMCTCGHPEEMHEHYRVGDDCGSCGPESCASFRARAETAVRRVVRRWRR